MTPTQPRPLPTAAEEARDIHSAVCRARAQKLVCSTCHELTGRAEEGPWMEHWYGLYLDHYHPTVDAMHACRACMAVHDRANEAVYAEQNGGRR